MKKSGISFPPYLLQRILRPYVWLALRLAFRRVFIRNHSNVPVDGPVILVGNHQAALIDSLLIHCFIRRRPFFLARADLFKKPLISKLLKQLRMLPIFRIRDGYDQLSKNEAIFEACADLLSKDELIALYPEGNHFHERRIRALKKGVARLIMHYHKRGDQQKSITLIPFGIHYEDPYQLRRRVRVEFGEAIEFKDLTPLIESEPVQFQKQLLVRVKSSLEKLSIHYRIKDSMNKKELLRKAQLKAWDAGLPWKDHFLKEQVMVQDLERIQESDSNQFETLIQEANQVETFDPSEGQIQRVKSAFQTLELFRADRWTPGIILAMAYIMTLPVWGLAAWICQQISLKLVKDPMFFTTLWFGSALLVFPIIAIFGLLLFYAFGIFLPGLLFLSFWTIVLLIWDYLLPGFFSIRFPSGDVQLRY